MESQGKVFHQRTTVPGHYFFDFQTVPVGIIPSNVSRRLYRRAVIEKISL